MTTVLEKKINFLINYLEDIIPDVLDEALEKGRNTAVRRCPVISGRLRGSIRTEKTDWATGFIGTNVEYAPFVEFGTSTRKATPFMWPGYKAAQSALKKGLKREIVLAAKQF